jgi:hypothetical protein
MMVFVFGCKVRKPGYDRNERKDPETRSRDNLVCLSIPKSKNPEQTVGKGVAACVSCYCLGRILLIGSFFFLATRVVLSVKLFQYPWNRISKPSKSLHQNIIVRYVHGRRVDATSMMALPEIRRQKPTTDSGAGAYSIGQRNTSTTSVQHRIHQRGDSIIISRLWSHRQTPCKKTLYKTPLCARLCAHLRVV